MSPAAAVATEARDLEPLLALHPPDARDLPELPAAPSVTAGPSADASAESPLDLEASLRTVGDDRELLTELAATFAADCPRRRGDLRRALEAGDASALRVSAHTLTGALASLGATPARRLAAGLERLGEEGRLDGAAELVARLEAELDRLVRFVAVPGWLERA